MSSRSESDAIFAEVVRMQWVVSNSPTLIRLFPTSTASHELSDSVVNDVLAYRRSSVALISTPEITVLPSLATNRILN